MSLLLALHLFATLTLVGLIWIVQVVHYPLFAFVKAEDFARYHREHVRRITWVVCPLMFLELGTGVLVVATGVATPLWLGWLMLALLCSNWVSTAVFQVPCHERLRKGFDADTHRRLVRTNVWRTFAWSVRGVLVFFLL